MCSCTCLTLLDCLLCFLFYLYCDHRYLHVLTHSFPTRRSSDLNLYIDLKQFEVNDDGEVDSDTLSAAVADLLTRKPHLAAAGKPRFQGRSAEHTSALQSLMRISYTVTCLHTNNNKRVRHQAKAAKTNEEKIATQVPAAQV